MISLSWDIADFNLFNIFNDGRLGIGGGIASFIIIIIIIILLSITVGTSSSPLPCSFLPPSF